MDGQWALTHYFTILSSLVRALVKGKIALYAERVLEYEGVSAKAVEQRSQAGRPEEEGEPGKAEVTGRFTGDGGSPRVRKLSTR